MLDKLWLFLLHPNYQEDENIGFNYRATILFRLLVIGIFASILLGALISLIASIFSLDFGTHAIETAMKDYSPWYILFAAVILAPFMEESIFRGPLVFFKSKPYFKYVFYTLTLIFGFYHITNFEISPTIILLAPILVSPQLIIGVILGYIRVRFGLWWSIALHAIYNLVLIAPICLIQIFNIPLE